MSIVRLFGEAEAYNASRTRRVGPYLVYRKSPIYVPVRCSKLVNRGASQKADQSLVAYYFTTAMKSLRGHLDDGGVTTASYSSATTSTTSRYYIGIARIVCTNGMKIAPVTIAAAVI